MNYKKKIFLISLIINSLSIFYGFGQNYYHSLYSDEGKLMFDSTFKVTNFATIPVILGKESQLNSIIVSRIHYPIEALRNGIAGKVVLKMELVREEKLNRFYIKNIISATDTLYLLTKDLIIQLEENLRDISFYQIEEDANIDSYSLYIPFEFDFTINSESPFKSVVELSINRYSFFINYFNETD